MGAALLAPPSEFVSAVTKPSWAEACVGAMLYLAALWVGTQVMRAKPPLELTALAVVHNAILIALSVLMLIGGLKALAERGTQEGFDGIFCSQRPEGTVIDGEAGYWMYVYYYSKYYELGDTMLLVLKKKAIIPLHVYHHLVMLFLTCSWVRFDWLEGSLWCVIVNSAIHMFMYVYYLLTALGKSVWWKKYLTLGQIIQFVTGSIYVSIYLWNVRTRGCGAATRSYAAWAAHVVNLSFILLFTKFYRDSFKSKNGKKANKSE